MLRLTLLLFLIIGTSLNVHSSHIVGGDFTATWVSANAGNTASTYRLKLTLYRDCDTGTAPFDQQILIGIFDQVTNQMIDSVRIDLAASGPLTLALSNQCSPPPQICVEGGVYVKNVEIPNNPNGYYMTWERCCRNITVNNLVSPDDTGITFYLEIPDPAMHNSTPIFQNDPLTYMCEQQPFSYNFGGMDPDGDSLVFSLVTPVSGNIGYPANPTPQAVWNAPIAAPYANAIWAAGYSLANICGGTPLTIDQDNGQLTAVPDFFGKYSAAVECKEYRNGVQIGMIRREIQFNVIICNTNSFPDVSFNQAVKNVTVNAGDTLCFNYFVRDNEGDSLFLTYSGDVFPGGTAAPPYAQTTNASDAANLSVNFCWITTCDHARPVPYNVVYTTTDNGCPFPLTVNDTLRITVTGAPIPEPAKMLCMDLTELDKIEVHFGINSNIDPKFFNFFIVYRSVNGSAFAPYDTIYNPAKRSFVDNNASAHHQNGYCFFIVGQSACEDNGLPSDTICSAQSINDLESYLKTVTVRSDNSILIDWLDFNNSDFANVYIYRKINAPIHQFQLLTVLNSPQQSHFVDKSVSTSDYSYCYFIITEDACGNQSEPSNLGCSILLTGVSQPFKHDLAWSEYRRWNGTVQKYELWRKANNENQFSKIDGIGFTTTYTDDKLKLDAGSYEYRVRAIEGFGSEDAESLSNVLVLEQQPLVFVPNAFSPNDDFTNEGWGAVASFVQKYSVSVYNRWGQLVFHTNNPNERWNGKYKGSPAPHGVYVYRMMIQPYGSAEPHHLEGSITLLR